MHNLVSATLIIVAVIHLLPLPGVLGQARLAALYGVSLNDPNLVLLEVRVRTAEFWEGPSSLIGKLLTFVVARATGNEEVLGENRILDLTGARKTLRAPPSSAQGKKKVATKTATKAATKRTKKPAKKVAADRK